MDRRTLLKTSGIASAAAGLLGFRGATANAAARGLQYVTYVGSDFKQNHGTSAQSTYWDNGSAYGIRVGSGGTGFQVKLALPDGATILEASANIRFNSGDGPVFLRVLAFDARDGYQVIGQKDVYNASPELI